MPIGHALAMWWLFRDIDEDTVFSIFTGYESGIPVDNLREASPVYHACERSRRARELKARIRPWEHIQTFLWVLEKSLGKKRSNGLPKFEWHWNPEHFLIAHANKKFARIDL